MKILRVTFRTFGPFTETTLKFPAASGLSIVQGRNEAGKSSALRGLHNLLFGFPSQTPDDFRFPYRQFRIEAEIEGPGGQMLHVVRRKGNKDTLRAADDREVIPESRLKSLLGQLDEQQFDNLFGMDATRFEQGGQDIAQGRGELGQALFTAAAGLKGLRRLKLKLEEQCEAIYATSRRNQLMNREVGKYQGLQQLIKEQMLSPEMLLNAQQAAEQDRQQHAELKQHHRNAQQARDRLRSYRAALPVITILKEARSKLADVAEAPRLPDDFEVKAQEAITAHKAAATRHQQCEEALRETEQSLEHLGPCGNDLGFDFDSLQKDHGVDETQRSERINIDRLAKEEEAAARDLYRALTGSKNWENMENLRLTLEQEQRIAELGMKADLIRENRDRTMKNHGRSEKELQALLEKPMPIAMPDDLRLAETVKSIRQLGDLGKDAQSRRRKRDTLANGILETARRLQPAVPGDWKKAASVPVPLLTEVRRFEERFRNLATEEAALLEKRNSLSEEQAKLSALLQETLRGMIPSDEELCQRRDRRDRGFGLIRRRLEGRIDTGMEDAFLTEASPGTALAEATEQDIRQCDAIVDRLRHDADQLAQLRAARQHYEEIQRLYATNEARLVEMEKIRATLHNDWLATWSDAGIKPATPDVMQEWHVNWQTLVSKVKDWSEQDERCQLDEDQIFDCIGQLKRFEPLQPLSGSLAELLTAAEEHLLKFHEAKVARDQYNRDEERLRNVAVADCGEAEEARTKYEDWQVEWRSAIQTLPLDDATASVATVLDYVGKIQQIQSHLKQERIKRSRLKEIDETRKAYLDRLTAAKRSLEPQAEPCNEKTLDDDFRFVRGAAQLHRQHQVRYQQLVKDRDDRRKKLMSAQDEFNRATTVLQFLLGVAGIQDAADLALVMRRARERDAQERWVKEQEQALAECSAGMPLETFTQDALAAQNGLTAAIEDIDRTLQELDEKIQTAASQARESERILAVYQKGSNAAAEARQQAALTADSIQEAAVEYASLHVALCCLQRAIEHYRDRHQGTLLARAGHFFSLLTLGAFSDLEIENDDGQDLLVGVRAANDRPDRRVSVDGFSSGTRDQLFLALRLAGIEQHLATREPVPLILDDLLVNYDDARAAATLTCLGELATRTQVVLFTHHDHLVELARHAIPELHVLGL